MKCDKIKYLFTDSHCSVAATKTFTATEFTPENHRLTCGCYCLQIINLSKSKISKKWIHLVLHVQKQMGKITWVVLTMLIYLRKTLTVDKYFINCS